MSDPNIQTIVDTAQEAVVPHSLGSGELSQVMVPDGARVAIVDTDIDRFRDAPVRKRGTVAVNTPDAFVRYLTKHGLATTEVFADLESRTVTAVVNADGDSDNGFGAGVAGFGDHRVVFKAKLTPEWLAWNALNGKLHEQLDLAEFVEDRQRDFHTPDAATMLEIAQTITATKGAQFESSQLLANGQAQIVYKEDLQGKAGPAGTLEIPREVTLALQPFEGTPRIMVDARFRYRLNGGRLSMGFKLIDPDAVLRHAFGRIIERIDGTDDNPGITAIGIPAVYEGTPAAANHDGRTSPVITVN